MTTNRWTIRLRVAALLVSRAQPGRKSPWKKAAEEEKEAKQEATMINSKMTKNRSGRNLAAPVGAAEVVAVLRAVSWAGEARLTEEAPSAPGRP